MYSCHVVRSCCVCAECVTDAASVNVSYHTETRGPTSMLFRRYSAAGMMSSGSVTNSAIVELRCGASTSTAGRGCPASQMTTSPVLRSLRHPSLVGSEVCAFRTVEWKSAMTALYRVILKMHAVALPSPAQRTFGDKFVKSEFRRHAMANEKYARIFYASWFDYVAQLDRGVTSRPLTASEQAMLSPEQKEKLAEIRSYVVQKRQTDGDFVL